MLNDGPIRNFIFSLKSFESRVVYTRGLSYFMKYLDIQDDTDYNKLLEGKDPKIIQSDIIDFIIHQKEVRNLSPATISTYVAAIRHFYDMNDVILNWKKINSFKGEFTNIIENEPYTREQIKRLIDAADPREKAMILLMASSGIRVGGLASLKVGDLNSIDKYQLYQITVYRQTKSEYQTFCTPECRKQLDEYLEWRKRMGEKITKESPLFRKVFDENDNLQIQKPKNLTVHTIHYNVMRLLNKSGVRPSIKMKEDQMIPKRTGLMQTHGFRKFFDTTCTKNGMDTIYSELLIGHSIGLKGHYTKLSSEELLEGNDKMLGYIGIVDELTINDENRLRIKVEQLTERQSEIQLIRAKHEQEMRAMREEINLQFHQIMSIIRQNPKLSQIKPEVLLRNNVTE
jgi:integrase